jgi:hypothetical protein
MMVRSRYASYNASTSDMSCGNFCKRNMSSAQPRHRSLAPQLQALFIRADVSRPFPSWNRFILTEIYLCHACSCSGQKH